jgi:hypothetical protein
VRRLRVLTWHTHGSYLHYLTHAPHEFFVVSKPGRPPGYAGVAGHLPWGNNVHDLPASEIKGQRLDCILFQDDAQYLVDQYELSAHRSSSCRRSISSTIRRAAARPTSGIPPTRKTCSSCT